MIRIECDAYLTVRDTEGRAASLSDVAPLLELVADTGSIAQAAQAKGLSYRHAWGMLRALEACIGGELIETARGSRRCRRSGRPSSMRSASRAAGSTGTCARWPPKWRAT